MAKSRHALIGLGSNVGDRYKNLRNAIKRISILPNSSIQQVSSVFESEPVGFASQKTFFNAALRLVTMLNPFDLLALTQEIENDLGRIRTSRWGPRSIDIDLLVVGDLNIRNRKLVLPHPQMTKRRFVLEPLNEIAAEVKVASYNQTIAKLLDACKDTHWVEFVAGPELIYPQIYEEVF